LRIVVNNSNGVILDDAQYSRLAVLDLSSILCAVLRVFKCNRNELKLYSMGSIP